MSTSRGPRRAELPPAVGERRRARERALGLLYEAELKHEKPDQVLAALPIPPEPYAVELFVGVGSETSRIDQLIDSHTTGWALERLPAVDRQVLRIATFELARRAEISVAVVIDEAVELAKQYSTVDSGRYVNGVLSAIAEELRPGEGVGRTVPEPPEDGG